jgi:Ca-activated chloride channel family protein
MAARSVTARLCGILTPALLVGATLAGADGVLIPDPPGSRLSIRYHHVKATLADQVAHTAVDQTFHNPEARDLEATYLFPVPVDASISAFSLYVDGQPLAAEILSAAMAREIYEGIVRQRLDPGLLEYVGQGAYRARIFPVPGLGDKRLELAYDEVVTRQGGVYRYTYPLNTEKFSATPLEEVSVTLQLHASRPLKAIYSPSHAIVVERDGEFDARVVWADENATPAEDFVLYYTVADEAVGVDLLTWAPAGDSLAYYLLLAAPQVDPPEAQVIPKRLVLVLDRSGSMLGPLFDQARAALRFVIRSLDEQDQVNVVDYGTAVAAFADSAVPATAANREALLAYVDGLAATGGTYIDGALARSLAMVRGDDRAEIVLFLTDGRPTIGERDTEAIVARAAATNQGRARLFALGVGFEVNTHLLDRLAGDNGGTTTYVKPGEDLEVAVSALYQQVSSPVLENLQVSFAGARDSEAYPLRLPDLFRGGQVVQLGRLAGTGEVGVQLTGTVQGRPVEFRRQVRVDRAGPEFLARLWATRKVGFLLDQIRLYGEDAELVDEIVALSRRYGVITPYTSFLVVEDVAPNPPLAYEGFKADSGAGAVAASEAVRNYAEAATPTHVQSPQVRYVGDRAFYQRDGYWQDSQYDAALPEQRFAFGSPAYFALLEQRPEMGRYLALGSQVVVVVDGVAYRVSAAATGIDSVAATRPPHTQLEPNWPNPFNGATCVRFWLPAPGAVDLTVYDLAGQRVATLASGAWPAGEHVVSWDGRLDSGDRAASGLYTCRLVVGGERRSRKLLLLR